MDFLEKDLETILYENYKLFKEKRLPSQNYMLRQVNLGVYGTADLIGVSFSDTSKYANDGESSLSIYITIYELKKQDIDVNALMQIARYKTAIDRATDELNNYRLPRNNINFYTRGILIGKTIQTKGDFVFLISNIDWLKVYTYDMSFSGIDFERHSGYSNAGDTDTLANLGAIIMRHIFEQKWKIKNIDSEVIDNDIKTLLN